MKTKTIWKDWETYTDDEDYGHWLEKTNSRSGGEEVWFEWNTDARWINVWGLVIGNVKLGGSKNKIIGD